MISARDIPILPWMAALLILAAVGGCDLEHPPPPPGDAEVGTDATTDATDTADADELSPVGGSCDSPGECVDGALCIGNSIGVFTCMRKCDEKWTKCEDGSLCTPVGNGSLVCYTGGANPPGTSCQNQLQCDDGLLCVGLQNQDEFNCLPGCHVRKGGCSSTDFCKPLPEPPRGYCRSYVGARCGDASNSCAAGLKCSTSFARLTGKFPGGYCTQECSDDGDCGDGAVCRTYPGTDLDMCFSTCEYDADCRLTDAYSCLEPDDCAAQARSEDCEAFRGGASLCVDSELRDWSSN